MLERGAARDCAWGHWSIDEPPAIYGVLDDLLGLEDLEQLTHARVARGARKTGLYVGGSGFAQRVENVHNLGFTTRQRARSLGGMRHKCEFIRTRKPAQGFFI